MPKRLSEYLGSDPIAASRCRSASAGSSGPNGPMSLGRKGTGWSVEADEGVASTSRCSVGFVVGKISSNNLFPNSFLARSSPPANGGFGALALIVTFFVPIFFEGGRPSDVLRGVSSWDVFSSCEV